MGITLRLFLAVAAVWDATESVTLPTRRSPVRE